MDGDELRLDLEKRVEGVGGCHFTSRRGSHCIGNGKLKGWDWELRVCRTYPSAPKVAWRLGDDRI
jgi:hypothetical protein